MPRNTVTINGVTITSEGSIDVVNGRVIVDGKDLTPEAKEINISVQGDVASLRVDVCQSIQVTGNVGTLKTDSGDVKCGNVNGSVTTDSGKVECKDVAGSVETDSGDVECGSVGQDVTTDSGDVRCGPVRGDISSESGRIRK